MKSMTIRGIDEAMAAKLRHVAQQRGQSINQVVLDTIKKELGLEKVPKYTRIYDDLDHLFGTWTQDEFERIQARIATQRVIDKELWQ